MADSSPSWKIPEFEILQNGYLTPLKKSEAYQECRFTLSDATPLHFVAYYEPRHIMKQQSKEPWLP